MVLDVLNAQYIEQIKKLVLVCLVVSLFIDYFYE